MICQSEVICQVSNMPKENVTISMKFTYRKNNYINIKKNGEMYNLTYRTNVHQTNKTHDKFTQTAICNN